MIIIGERVFNKKLNHFEAKIMVSVQKYFGLKNTGPDEPHNIIQKVINMIS